MVITVTDTIKEKLIKLSVFTFFTLTIFPIVAGELLITPKLSVDEIYSDNVELIDNDKTESLVSLLAPGINIEYIAPRVNFDVDYSYTQAWYSHDHELDDNYNSLAAKASFRLFPKELTLNISASIRNVSQNNARNSLADLVSADTVEYKNYQAGLAYNVASSSFTIDSQINFILDEADDDVGEREGYDASILSESGINSRFLFWQISGQYTDYENDSRKGRFYTGEIITGYITGWSVNPYLRYYDEDTSGNLQDNKIQGTSSIGAGLRWQPFEHLKIDVAYNKVDEETPANGDVSDEQKDYTSGSINWQPSARTDLFAKYYQRFFGDAYQFTFNHRAKRLTTEITYSESLNLFDRLELVPVNIQDVWCLTSSPGDVGSCIFSPDDSVDLSPYTFVGLASDLELQQANSFSLNQTFSFSTKLALKRLTFKLDLRKQKRENLALEDYDTYEFASFSITRLMSRTTELNLRFSFNKNNLNQNTPLTFGQMDYYHLYNINWKKQLNRSLSVTLSAKHLNRNSNRFGYSYKENRASLQVIKEF